MSIEALIQLNNRQLQDSQALRLDRLAMETEKPVSQGKYLGYDADTGMCEVQLLDFSIVQGRFITNGSVPIGAMVSVSRPAGGVPIFDAMPR